MGKEAFIAAAWTVVGRRVSKTELLSDIYETAKTSVGLPVGPDSDAIAMFRTVLAEGRSLTRQRNEIEARSIELLSGLTDYRLLTSIPGIGPINAMTILAEAGDVRRFPHHRQFLKFCGMDLATVRSGMFRGQSKISKYGNARLRRTLWMAGTDGRPEADQQLPRQVRTLHRPGPAQPAPEAQGLHRHRRQDGADRTRRDQARRTLSPLLRGGEPGRKDPSRSSRGGVNRPRR